MVSRTLLEGRRGNNIGGVRVRLIRSSLLPRSFDYTWTRLQSPRSVRVRTFIPYPAHRERDKSRGVRWTMVISQSPRVRERPRTVPGLSPFSAGPATRPPTLLTTTHRIVHPRSSPRIPHAAAAFLTRTGQEYAIQAMRKTRSAPLLIEKPNTRHSLPIQTFLVRFGITERERETSLAIVSSLPITASEFPKLEKKGNGRRGNVIPLDRKDEYTNRCTYIQAQPSEISIPPI